MHACARAPLHRKALHASALEAALRPCPSAMHIPADDTRCQTSCCARSCTFAARTLSQPATQVFTQQRACVHIRCCSALSWPGASTVGPPLHTSTLSWSGACQLAPGRPPHGGPAPLSAPPAGLSCRRGRRCGPRCRSPASETCLACSVATPPPVHVRPRRREQLQRVVTSCYVVRSRLRAHVRGVLCGVGLRRALLAFDLQKRSGAAGVRESLARGARQPVTACGLSSAHHSSWYSRACDARGSPHTRWHSACEQWSQKSTKQRSRSGVHRQATSGACNLLLRSELCATRAVCTECLCLSMHRAQPALLLHTIFLIMPI